MSFIKAFSRSLIGWFYNCMTDEVAQTICRSSNTYMCNSNSKDFKPKRSTRRPIKSYYSTLIMNSLETKMKSRIALIKFKDYWLKSCFIYCLSRFISGPSIPVCWINFTIFSIDIELATSSEHLMINLVNSVVGFFFWIEACSSSRS